MPPATNCSVTAPFLTEHQPNSPALDYKGDEIKDQNDQNVLVRDVPLYQSELAKDPENKPWWAGDLTSINGYFFSEHGASYCTGNKLGCTMDIQPLEQGDNGQVQGGKVLTTVILCPESFNSESRPNTYREANNQINVNKSLAAVVPKSATLLHEVFHLVHGGKLSATDEEYG